MIDSWNDGFIINLRKKTFFRLKNIHFCILGYKTFYVLTTKDQHGMTNQ